MKRISLSIIFIATTVLIVFAVFYFYLNPSLNSAWLNYKEIKKSQDTLKGISQKKEILQKLSLNNQLTDAYTIASNYIPEQEDSGDLVIGLSEMAKQSKLTVEQISFDKPTAKSSEGSDTAKQTDNTASNTQTASNTDFKEIEFSMKVSGTFTDFLTFINNLEKSSRLVTITAMDLTQSADKAFGASIKGKAYWQKTANLDTSLTAINISPDIINKFKNLKSYGQPINLQTESGFGRPDPFSTY